MQISLFFSTQDLVNCSLKEHWARFIAVHFGRCEFTNDSFFFFWQISLTLAFRMYLIDTDRFHAWRILREKNKLYLWNVPNRADFSFWKLNESNGFDTKQTCFRIYFFESTQLPTSAEHNLLLYFFRLLYAFHEQCTPCYRRIRVNVQCSFKSIFISRSQCEARIKILASCGHIWLSLLFLHILSHTYNIHMWQQWNNK